MKKSFLILILIILISQFSLAESNRKSFVTFCYNRSLFDDASTNIFGLNFEIFLTQNLSLNYSFGLGQSRGGMHFHLPAGLIGGIYTIFDNAENESLNIDDDNSSGFIYGGSVLLMFLPEGINYYFPLSNYISLGVFANPFGYDYLRGFETVNSTFGLKAAFNINDKILFIPHLGYSIFWKETGVPSVGLSFGVKM